MAFLSRFILQPILSRESTSWLRVLATRKPWYPLIASTFKQDCIIKKHLEASNLFSTDSTKPKQVQGHDNTVAKRLNSNLKKTTRLYTEEQDELILNRVKEMGYDNPETWKSLAKELNAKRPDNVKRRYDLLVKRGSGRLQRRHYTVEEDAIILARVKEMGYKNIDTWRAIAKELNRDIIDSRYLSCIRDRYDLIISRETKEPKRFTEDDDKLIMRFVKKHGEEKSTWEKLAIKLGINDRRSANVIQGRHDLLLVKDSIVTGAFTEEEDRIILNDVETYGNNLQTFKELCKTLNRHRPDNIRGRYEWLQNRPSEPPGAWNFRHDKMLIEHIFQVHR